LIIECSKCGTPQYIRKGQQSRICPKCHFHITCKNQEPIANASSELEAQQIVQSMKIPNELELRMHHLHNQLTSSDKAKSNPYYLFNNVISQLLGPFPNTIPLLVIYSKTQEIGLEDKFIDKILQELNTEGYLLQSTDSRGNELIKFTNLPIHLDKIHIQRPDPNFMRRVTITDKDEKKDGTD
jgi:uncharacterized Zn finger protein (UPF0148 family)